MVLTNPPFGKKSSVTSLTNRVTRRNNRSLFIATISGRARASASRTGITAQFPSARHGTSPSVGGHVFTILKQHGRAAIPVPDNVLFKVGASVRGESFKCEKVY